MMAWYLIWIILFRIAITTDLSSNYTQNTVLTKDNTPYYVVSDVKVSSNTTLSIENGVEIIFTDDYTIDVQGYVSACNGYDSGSNNVGLANTSEYIYIHSNLSPTPIGRISVSSGSATFCNTKFQALYYAASDRYNIYNSEFVNLEYATYDTSSAVISTVTNSYFLNNENINYGVGVIYDGCIFRNFTNFFANNGNYATYIAMRNNQIYGNGNNLNCVKFKAFTGSPSQAVYNNSIENCGFGMYVQDTAENQGIIIQYNTVKDCYLYGISCFLDDVTVRYNTFINNIGYSLVTSGINTTISYNTFINPDTYALACSTCINVSIEYNTFDGGVGRSISTSTVKTSSPKPIYIQYNNFSNLNGLYNIYLSTSDPDRFYIRNNRFISNTGTAAVVYIQHGNYVEINGNYFENNTVQADNARLIYCKSGWYPYADSYIINNTIIGNHIIGTNQIEILKVDIQQGGGAGSTTIQGNVIKNNYVAPASGTSGSYRFNTNNVIHLKSVKSVTIQYNVLMNNIGDNNSTIFAPCVIMFVDNNVISSKDKTVIQYNDFNESNNMDSYIYMYGYVDPNALVQYNNFYSFDTIKFFIAIDDGNNLTFAEYNYYGTGNYSIIDNKMQDTCQADLSGTISNKAANLGIITWFPYYVTAISSGALSSSEVKVCERINICEVTCHDYATGEPTEDTSQPSQVPTQIPSTNPTSDPTVDPTYDPTSIPTSNPTLNPSVHPSAYSVINTGSTTGIGVTYADEGHVHSTFVYSMLVLYCVVPFF